MLTSPEIIKQKQDDELQKERKEKEKEERKRKREENKRIKEAKKSNLKPKCRRAKIFYLPQPGIEPRLLDLQANTLPRRCKSRLLPQGSRSVLYYT